MRRAGLILLAWWFLGWNYYWSRTIGPFATQAECEEVRTDVAGSRSLNAVESWGGVSKKCWDDGATAPLSLPRGWMHGSEYRPVRW
jgi:hypothetical protein